MPAAGHSAVASATGHDGAAVIVDGLRVDHGHFTAVHDVSFAADAGEVVVLLGPNGAGKTSTVETAEGYLRAAAGSVRVLGLDPGRDRKSLVGRIGVMLQDGGVYPGIRPAEMLELAASMYPDPLDPDALLERVGLADRRAVAFRHLSGGEKQRLSLALALVGKPEVAFLDEPTAGVDVQGRQVIRSVIAELAADGCAVVLSTHELDEAERLADRVVVIDRGRTVADGTLDELRRNRGDGIRFTTSPGVDTRSLAERLDGEVTETAPGDYRVSVVGGHAGHAELTAAVSGWLAEHDLPLGGVRAGTHRLEDVFLALTDGSGPQAEVETLAPGRRRRRRRT